MKEYKGNKGEGGREKESIQRENITIILTSGFEWSAEEQATALLTRSSCTAKSVYVLVLSRHSHLTVRERERVCVVEIGAEAVNE